MSWLPWRFSTKSMKKEDIPHTFHHLSQSRLREWMIFPNRVLIEDHIEAIPMNERHDINTLHNITAPLREGTL